MSLKGKSQEFVSKCPHKWKFRLARITDVENVDLLRHTIQPNFDTPQTVDIPFVIIL